MSYLNGSITVDISGAFDSPNPLGNVTIAGLEFEPSGISINGLSLQGTSTAFSGGALSIKGLEGQFAASGVFQQDSYMPPVTQIADGQIQVPSTPQSSGGQIRATGST